MLVAGNSVSAAVIQIDGELQGSTGGTDWTGPFSNSSAAITDTVVDDGTVTLTAATNGQVWTTSGQSGVAGQEWNLRQGGGSDAANTAAEAFSKGTYLVFTIDSTSNASATFTLDAISASVWRNGAQAPNNFQLAYNSGAAAWETSDLLGTVTTIAGSGTGDAATLSFSSSPLPGSSTTSDEYRLYWWDTTGSDNELGNFHIYDTSATYTVVPEPSSALMALAGVALCAIRRRRA